MTHKTHALPGSILFICYLNSIRSPMAEGLMKKRYGDKVYVQSCGLEQGELDDLMVAVMRESGIDMSAHNARTLTQLQDGLFDTVIAFTQGAGDAARAVFEGCDTQVLVWPTPDPTGGALDVRAMMDNYRSVRSFIDNRLKARYGA
ncbi:MAG: low molecular weight phosphatase family protein [Robiginitomaculum sp.]